MAVEIIIDQWKTMFTNTDTKPFYGPKLCMLYKPEPISKSAWPSMVWEEEWVDEEESSYRDENE